MKYLFIIILLLGFSGIAEAHKQCVKVGPLKKCSRKDHLHILPDDVANRVISKADVGGLVNRGMTVSGGNRAYRCDFTTPRGNQSCVYGAGIGVDRVPEDGCTKGLCSDND